MATRGKPQTKEAKLLDMLYGKPAAGDLRNTPMLKQTGEGSYLRQQHPEVYGFGAGLLGTLPNDISGSVLDPNTARVKQGAVYGLPTGVALEALPFAGPALKGAKMTGKALGSGLNEAIYHGAQSPLSKFIPESVKPLYAVKNKGGGGNVFGVENNLKQLKPNADINPRDADELGIAGRGDAAISNWIDTKLTKYVKNDLGTENDPVRLLAEKGKLHFDPDVASGRRTRAQQNRRTAGFPEQGASESQLAVDWEALADSQMQPWTSGGPDIPAGAQAYKFGTSFQSNKVLGFDHLVDELRNATTLGDNLPKVLQIDPKKLEQMSVSEVVNHVFKINEWRANQATRSHDATIKALENSPAISVMKEYPDGYKWVELKMPDTVHDVTPLIRKDGDMFEIYEPGQSLSWKDPNTGRVGWSSPEEASAAYSEIKNYRELEKVLELEGNSMGHCVGGYCSDVMSGRSRIFSLRDPKGRSHATIQVDPNPSLRKELEMGDVAGREEAEMDQLYRHLEDVLDERGVRNAADIVDTLASGGNPPARLRQVVDAAFAEAETRMPKAPKTFDDLQSIVQIKGKQNARPVEKYDPYTQDFVQNNDWGEVNELRNTGLVDLGNKNYKSLDEIKKTYQYLDDTVDPPQWTNLGELVERDFPNGVRRDNFLTGVAERLKEQAKRTDLPEMIRPAPVEPKPASPYLQEVLPAAEADANLAKYLEPSKEQGRWYTGTSSDVHEFDPSLGLEKPGQAGATFVSQSKEFPFVFARDAHLSNPNLERQLTPEKIELAKQNAEKYFRDTYPDMPEHADEMIRSIQAGKPVGEAEDALKDAYRELMPAGPNIMPVYVRTTNPFDFANPEHVASLKAIYPDLPELNRTSILEQPEIQDAIKKAGFDAFYTAEGGNRNLGLFQPTQLKSAIGNAGTYDVANPLIYKKHGGSVRSYKEGGSVTDPIDEQAAFGIYPNAGKRSQKSDIGDRLNASLIPQDALDLAMTIAPFGKVGKILAAAIVSGAPTEAQAGNMSALLKLVAKEAPEQFHSIREALLRTFNTGLEHSVVGSTHMGGPSQVVQGLNASVIPNRPDIVNARRNIDQSGLIDFHTHPRQNVSVSDFKITPSGPDLQAWMSQYGGSRTATTPNEIKTMIGSLPDRAEGTTSAYNFFATNKPNQTLDRRAYDAARYELQSAKSLQELKDNPVVRRYLEAGGTLGDIFESASPMLLQKLYAQKGLGRHDMRLSNAPTTTPAVTEGNLFNEIVNPAIEVLKAKRFAEGGSVSTLAKFKR